jgi:hypothetical protein
LSLFREHCFTQVKSRICDAILGQISRDRDNELVDLGLVKVAIFTFVAMGFKNVNIVKQGDEFVWSGEKDNQIYLEDF